jgi:hypothetical protein
MNSPSVTAWSRLRRGKLAMISLGVVTLYVLAAVGTEIYAAWCESHENDSVYQVADDAAHYLPPSPEHWMEPNIRTRTCCCGPSPEAPRRSRRADRQPDCGGHRSPPRRGRRDSTAKVRRRGGLCTNIHTSPRCRRCFHSAFALLVSRNFPVARMMRFAELTGKRSGPNPECSPCTSPYGITGCERSAGWSGPNDAAANMPFVAAARVAGVTPVHHPPPHSAERVPPVIIYFTLSFAGRSCSK